MRAPFLLASALLAPALLAALAAAPASAAPFIITEQTITDGTIPGSDSPGFPGTISEPGSYRLGGNINVPNNTIGLSVTTTDVAIDLDGFRITGGPAGGANNGTYGVSTSGDRLTVRNGTITGFRTAGIRAESKLFLVVEDMRVINNALGINALSGKFTRILNSTISLNLTSGVRCGQSCHVEGSIISSNGSHGITITSGTVLGSTLADNIGYAISASTSIGVGTGMGNNSVINNNQAGAGGGLQTYGKTYDMQPNACEPDPC